MNHLETRHQQIQQYKKLEVLASQVVEGFISGMHKSSFHGFSSEFAEHKLYNNGESTKYIDWKLYARTERLYTKRYEEETNLRAHIIIDNSSSMHYPLIKNKDDVFSNKLGFSVLASAVLMNILKRQRDAVGLSIYAQKMQYYSPEKGNERHHAQLLDRLNDLLSQSNVRESTTNTVENLHLIAEKIHRRSLIFLFTDFLQNSDQDKLFDALHHLKHNKHKVVLFHVHHKATELDFNFGSTPRKFVDLESGTTVELFADQFKETYQKQAEEYFKTIKQSCMKYKIRYVPVAIEDNFDKVISSYLIEKQLFR